MVVTIITVDDHQIILDGLRKKIEEYPEYRLIGETKSGQEAIKLTLEKSPTILLLDLKLPDIPGFQVARAIKQQNSHTKIIIVSQYGDKAKVDLCFRSGADGFLFKGGTTSLRLAIETVLEGKQFFDPQLKEFIESEVFTPALIETFGLTTREAEILEILPDASIIIEDIAQRLCITTSTVKAHLASIYSKMHVTGRPEAVQKLRDLGLLY
jgi:DNA-binding NarL/FixJ family response regulator